MTKKLTTIMDELNIGISHLLITSLLLVTETRELALADALGEEVHPDTKKFIRRILSPSRWDEKRINSNGFLEIPAIEIEKVYSHQTRSDIPKLVKEGILSRDSYKKEVKCFGYKVNDQYLLESYAKPITIEEPKFFIDNSVAKKPSKSPTAILADRCIPYGLVNVKAVSNFLSSKKDEDVCTIILCIQQLTNCLGNLRETPEGIISYNQDYSTSEIGGRVYSSSGDWAISRELKSHWFNIPNVYNYDIRSCHPSIFNSIHPTTFCEKWIMDHDGFRSSLAAAIGISIPTLKQGILCLTYGAQPIAKENCSIYKLFLQELKHTYLTTSALSTFSKLTTEYRQAVSNWVKEIKADPRSSKINAIGFETNSTDHVTLMSHFLTGKEQEAIQWISSIKNQDKGSYQVISNQFDGVITQGEIPDNFLLSFHKKFNLTLEPKPLL